MKNVCNKNTFSAIFPMQKNSDKIVTFFNCYGKLLIYSAAFLMCVPVRKQRLVRVCRRKACKGGGFALAGIYEMLTLSYKKKYYAILFLLFLLIFAKIAYACCMGS